MKMLSCYAINRKYKRILFKIINLSFGDKIEGTESKLNLEKNYNTDEWKQIEMEIKLQNR